MTLGGEEVTDHDSIRLQWTQYIIQRFAIGESYQNLVTLRGGGGEGARVVMSQ